MSTYTHMKINALTQNDSIRVFAWRYTGTYAKYVLKIHALRRVYRRAYVDDAHSASTFIRSYFIESIDAMPASGRRNKEAARKQQVKGQRANAEESWWINGKGR